MTFEHRYENKSCSACPEDQLKLFKISNFQIFKKFQIFSGSQLLSDFQTFFYKDDDFLSCCGLAVPVHLQDVFREADPKCSIQSCDSVEHSLEVQRGERHYVVRWGKKPDTASRDDEDP